MKKSGGGGSGGHKMKARFFFSPLFALLLAAILPLIFYSSSPSSPLPLFVLQLLPHNPLNMCKLQVVNSFLARSLAALSTYLYSPSVIDDLSTIKDMACIQFHPILHFFNAIFHCPSLNAATKTSGPSVVDEQQSQLLFNSNNPSPSPCIFCDISNTGHGQTRIVYQVNTYIYGQFDLFLSFDNFNVGFKIHCI